MFNDYCIMFVIVVPQTLYIVVFFELNQSTIALAKKRKTNEARIYFSIAFD